MAHDTAPAPDGPPGWAGRDGRRAVAAAFMVNGAVAGAMLPRFPELRDGLHLSDAQFGIALLGIGVGGLVGSAMAAPVVDRLGEAAAVRWSGVVHAADLAVLGVVGGGVLGVTGAPAGVAALFLALFAVGLLDAVHDVAMNHAGLAVQRAAGRSVLGRYHALWSAGTVAAAALASAAAAAQVPVTAQLVASAGLLAVVQAVAPRGPTANAAGVADAAGVVDSAGVVDGAPEPLGTLATQPLGAVPSSPGGLRARSRRWPFALVAAAVAAAWIEGPVPDWSAIHLGDVLGASPGLAGLAPTVVVGGMFLGRMGSDRLIDRLGAARVAFLSAAAVGAAMAFALLVGGATDSIAITLLGYFALGVGTAPVFPLLFTAGERLPGGGAVGSGIVAGVSRAGFLVAPAAVGVLAELIGIDRALWVVVGGAAVLGATLPRQLRGTRTI